MPNSSLDRATREILAALTGQAEISFRGVVADIEQHVIPTMASIAHGLAVTGARLADGIFTKDIADIHVAALLDAAASVIVRFANRILKEIQDIINAVIGAVRDVINTAVGVALL